MTIKKLSSLAGVSTVYMSYIENGLRPAPSEKVLDKIAAALSLDKKETKLMRLLASLSHPKMMLNKDILAYISKNQSVADTLEFAKEYDIDEIEWRAFMAQMKDKYQ